MNVKIQIKNHLTKIGQKTQIVRDDSVGKEFRCLIQPIRYRNKMYLQDNNTLLGLSNQDYYLYIGPYDVVIEKHNILKTPHENFIIIKCEEIYIKDEIVYYWAVLKRLKEDEQ